MRISTNPTRTAARAGVGLMALVLVGCGGSPSAPSLSVNDTTAVQSSRHILTITAAASCPNSGQGTLFTRNFEFEMTLTSSNGGLFFSLKQPAGPLISGPNSGELSATFAPGVGFINGSGLASDGVHIVALGSRQQLPIEGSASMFVDDGVASAELSGHLMGMISMSVYKSSAGGSCYAASHTWKLKPKG